MSKVACSNRCAYTKRLLKEDPSKFWSDHSKKLNRAPGPTLDYLESKLHKEEEDDDDDNDDDKEDEAEEEIASNKISIHKCLPQIGRRVPHRRGLSLSMYLQPRHPLPALD